MFLQVLLVYLALLDSPVLPDVKVPRAPEVYQVKPGPEVSQVTRVTVEHPVLLEISVNLVHKDKWDSLVVPDLWVSLAFLELSDSLVR